MLELGQNLPFLAEPFAEEICSEGQVNEFDGHFLLKLPVSSMRQVDGSHAAAAQEVVKLVGPNSLMVRRFFGGYAVLQVTGGCQMFIGFARLQQGPDLSGKFQITAASSRN
jgi:hypothetical protein